MSNKIKAYEVPLKNIKPYVEPIKKHFGLYHPDLEPELLLLESDPERTYIFYEFVTSETIVALFDKYFPKVEEHTRSYTIDVLWLVGNLYYGTNYDAYEDYFDDIARDDLIWDDIKRDLYALFVFMKDHQTDNEVTIRFGKGEENAITLQNDFHWFQGLMENQLFPNTIPEITDKKEAKALLRKKAGRPTVRKEVNAIVNGVASSFAEFDIVKGKAPIQLLNFIHDFLVAMDLIKQDDTYVTTTWIKSQISNFQKPGKDPKFFTTEIRSCSLDDLKKSDLHIRGLNWLLPPKGSAMKPKQP